MFLFSSYFRTLLVIPDRSISSNDLCICPILAASYSSLLVALFGGFVWKERCVREEIARTVRWWGAGWSLPWPHTCQVMGGRRGGVGFLHRQRTRLAGSNGTETSKTLQRRTCMGVHLFFFFILNMGSHFDILNGTSIGNRPAHNLTFSVICSKRAGPFFFFEVGLCVAWPSWQRRVSPRIGGFPSRKKKRIGGLGMVPRNGKERWFWPHMWLQFGLKGSIGCSNWN